MKSNITKMHGQQHTKTEQYVTVSVIMQSPFKFQSFADHYRHLPVGTVTSLPTLQQCNRCFVAGRGEIISVLHAFRLPSRCKLVFPSSGMLCNVN